MVAPGFAPPACDACKGKTRWRIGATVQWQLSGDYFENRQSQRCASLSRVEGCPSYFKTHGGRLQRPARLPH